MKSFTSMLFVLALSASTLTGHAQFASTSQEPTHLVQYGDAPKLDTHRPDFSGATVAIDLREPFRHEAFNQLRALHVTGFIEGKLPCERYQTPVICIRASSGGTSGPVSSSSYSSGNGRNGSAYGGASFNGTLTSLVVEVRANYRGADGQLISEYLGSEYDIAPAGTSTEYMSGSNRTSSGSFGYTVSSGLDTQVVRAIDNALTGLFVSAKSFTGFGKRWFAHNVINNPWSPGADLEVAKMFSKKTETVASPQIASAPTAPQTYRNELADSQ